MRTTTFGSHKFLLMPILFLHPPIHDSIDIYAVALYGVYDLIPLSQNRLAVNIRWEIRVLIGRIEIGVVRKLLN